MSIMMDSLIVLMDNLIAYERQTPTVQGPKEHDRQIIDILAPAQLNFSSDLLLQYQTCFSSISSVSPGLVAIQEFLALY